MEIKMVKLSEIRPYFNNPRDNSKAIEPTMHSIEKFTFTKPIIVDRDGVIIAGHTRYIAAFRLGLTEVPVLYSDLDEEKAKAFRIADNKLAEKSYFDDTKLVQELKEMEIPNELQHFFFEDIGQMINNGFDFNSVTGKEDMSYETSEEEYDPVEENENAEEYNEQEEENETKLFTKLQDENGTYMNIMCPYCNSLEKVYL